MVAHSRTWPGLSALFALLLCLLSSTALAQTTFLVTNTNDSGAGSLRQAILNAESHVSDSIIIQFNSPFPANGTINLASALPRHSFATEITYADGRLRLGGRTMDLPDALTALESSGRFADSRPVGALTREEGGVFGDFVLETRPLIRTGGMLE